MRILKIKISNITSFRGDIVIDFTSGPLSQAPLFAITGDTGSGKSTILDAVCLALYNRAPRYNLKEKGDNIALIVRRNSLDKAWYVGDIQGDYDATMKAGLDFIHAAYGFGTIKQTVPELERFSDLPELLDTL